MSVGNPAVQRSTDRPTIWEASFRTPGPFEQRSEGNALPDGVVDQVTADFVGHALERDGFLDRVESEQFVVGERERPIDQPGYVEPPCPDVDLWDDERGVDAVEVGVRCDVRRKPGHRERLGGGCRPG